MVFCMFHGQAFVERGFSVNSDVIDHNMLESTIVAQRRICDAVGHLLSTEGVDDPKAVHKLNINKDMLRYCKLARSKYRTFLDEQNISKKNDALIEKTREKKTMIEYETKKLRDLEKKNRGFIEGSR